MARGHIMACSCDANRNVVGRANANPILDTRKYQVEFAGGNVTELNSYVTVESMYAQCDVDGNYLLLHLMVDYHKDNKTITLTNQ